MMCGRSSNDATLHSGDAFWWKTECVSAKAINVMNRVSSVGRYDSLLKGKLDDHSAKWENGKMFQMS